MTKKILKKNKINFIIFPGNYLPQIGGLETHVDEFVKKLSFKDEYKITIFTPNILNSKEFEIKYNNVNIIRYPAFFLVENFPFPKFWSLKFWRLFLNLYRTKFEVVMTRTMFFTNTSLGTFFAKIRFRKIKLIHVEHGSNYSKLDSKIKSFFNKLYMNSLGKLTLILADKIVCVSNGTKKFLIKEFNINPLKLSIIRRGFDYNKLNLIKENLKIKNKYKNKIIISFVGRLIDGKGVQDIIKILNYSEFKKKKYIFLIIGDGNYKKELQKLVKKYELNNSIKFLGKLSHNEVVSILKISNIFVNPSYTEGLPTAVLDGFFTKNKILATNVGGTYEILNKTWNSKRYKLVKAKDLLQIKKKLLELFKVKSKFDEKLYNEIKTKFDWEEHTSKYDIIIKSLLKNK